MISSPPQIQARQILDIVYPIGIIQQFYDNTDPNDIMQGQTWVKLENVFLYGSGTKSVGTAGGEENHTLSVNEMPRHTHTQNAHTHTQNSHRHGLYSNDGYNSNSFGFGDGNSGKGVAGMYRREGNVGLYYNCRNDGQQLMEYVTPLINNTTATNQNTGGSQAHNNMPPYRVVGIWRRTA